MTRASSFTFYEQLLNYTEAIFSDVAQDISLPLDLNASHVLPLKKNNQSYEQTYSFLVNADTRLLRLRFEMLKQFNVLIRAYIGYINLDGRCLVSSNLFQHRHLIYHTIKMEAFYNILDSTSAIEGKQPTAKINRYHFIFTYYAISFFNPFLEKKYRKQ